MKNYNEIKVEKVAIKTYRSKRTTRVFYSFKFREAGAKIYNGYCPHYLSDDKNGTKKYLKKNTRKYL